MVTVVTSQSWLGRIRDSFKRFLVGLALFVASFPILFWNEGRAVKTEKSLEEGAGAVVSVPADRVDHGNDQKLVHLSGLATTNDTLSDSEFGVSANAIKLRRRVEMYQWKESKQTKEEKKLGGGTETKTTYSYSKDWNDSVIDSGSFYEASTHPNPSAMPFESREVSAEEVTVGAFTLPPSLIGKISDYDTLPVNDETLEHVPGDLKEKLKIQEGRFYIASNPASPEVGDVRITFEVVVPQDVSIVSKQKGNTFEAYHASAGMDIEMLRRGVHSAQSMFQMALRENTIMTWVLRGVGFVLMFIGLAMFFGPISVLGDVVPFFGSLLAFGTGLFAFLISIVLSLGTIGIAWVFYRPVLGITLLASAIAVLVVVAISGRKKVSARTAVPAVQS